MRQITYYIAIFIGLFSVLGFAVGWLGPVSGEGWGRGWNNVIMMIGSGVVGLAMVALVGIIRLVGEDRNQATILYTVAIGVNILPIIGVALMFLGLVRIK